MNVHMWEHPATQQHVEIARTLGYTVISPEEGELACGYEGKGRLPKNEIILEVLWKVLSPKKDLAGKKILVTAGPTREFMDPVRFLSNPSSGKMGFAIAKTAWYRGGEVTLIKGPTCIEPVSYTHLNVIVANRIIAIIHPDSSPVKRLRDEARERGQLIDATQGRKTRAVILTLSLIHIFI